MTDSDFHDPWHYEPSLEERYREDMWAEFLEHRIDEQVERLRRHGDLRTRGVLRSGVEVGKRG